MTQYALTKENKGATDAVLDFPVFKPQRKGERARIALFSPKIEGGRVTGIQTVAPDGGYFFELRNPKVDRRQADAFKGRYECLAPEADKMADRRNADECPHCLYVLEGRGRGIFGDLRRRFVVPIVRYQTDTRGAVITPFSVEVLLWSFTDSVFNILVDEDRKWRESGGLLGHDLMLTCEIKEFHRWAISVEPDAAYRADKDRFRHTLRTYVALTNPIRGRLLRRAGLTLSADSLRERLDDVIREVEGSYSDTVATSPVEAESLQEVFGAGGARMPVEVEVPGVTGPSVAAPESPSQVGNGAPAAVPEAPASGTQEVEGLDFADFMDQIEGR